MPHAPSSNLKERFNEGASLHVPSSILPCNYLLSDLHRTLDLTVTCL